jgi:CRP-like cAMP-binding protein
MSADATSTSFAPRDGGSASSSLMEEYEEMQRTLAALAARGVELPSSGLPDESALTHLELALRHLWRGLFVGCASALRCWQPKPHVRSAATHDKDEFAPVGMDAVEIDGTPKAEVLSARGLIMPVGTWKEKWDICILLLILYSAIVVPVRVCFDADAQGVVWLLEVSMTLAFIVDMGFTFNQVYFDATTGQWITSRSEIAKNYLSGWFWIDAPSSVPVELVDLFLGDVGSLGLLRFLRMFRLLRLLRLLKIEEYIDTLENALDMNLRILRVVFMLVKICFLSHILGCFWFYTAVLSKTTDGTTWTASYDDGRLEYSDAGLSIKYLYSVYWAVTTLTTVGYGDLVPTNDAERTYALCAMLLSALVFGYMISNIGSLVASMDRQAAIIEEKTDAVKEYVAFRGLPRDLSLRVKKHYSFYYSRRAAFDEVELLEGLSPSLRSEVTRFVLKETLGKLPLFAQQLDPEFQMEVFPHIKPVSYAIGEVVFSRGDPSRDLIFLLKGEVSVHSPLDGHISSIIKPTEEVILSKSPNPSEQEALMVLQHSGCFGETVLTGRRRQATHRAVQWCETLVLAKDDLVTLFAKNPRAGKRVVRKLLAEVERKEKLQHIVMRFIISSLQPRSEVRCALVIQKAWSRYAARVAAESTNSPSGVFTKEELDPNSEGGSISATVNDTLKLARGVHAAAEHAPSAEQVLDAAEVRVKALFEGLKADVIATRGVGVSGGAGASAGQGAQGEPSPRISAEDARKSMGM